MRHRQPPSLKRRPPNREPRQRFTLFCEGKRTEPAYFGALRIAVASALVHVRITPAVGVPYTIAEEAVKMAREGRRKKRDLYEERDEIWAVFDRDEHPRYDDAIKLCEGQGVKVARSNPCFEVWLILHEQDYDKPDGRKVVQAHLRSIRPEYDPGKGKEPNCAELVARVVEAERRAEAMCARRDAEGSPYGPPSTTVYLLTRAIRMAADAATPAQIAIVASEAQSLEPTAST